MPEVGAFAGAANGAPGTAGKREVEEKNGVRGGQADFKGVVGAQVAIHDPFSWAASLSWIFTHSSRGMATSPGCQKILSSSITGRPVISPRRAARVDLPDAPRPRMITRFTVFNVRQLIPRVVEQAFAQACKWC